MRKMTVKEIARLVGVSSSTVSIVLNGKQGVGEETRTKILDVLQQNGFSHSKREASIQKGGVIRFYKIAKHGQIVNDKHNVFIADYIDGIAEEGRLHGLNVEIAAFNNTPLRSVCEDISAAANLDGCIILATELSEEDLAIFSEIEIPLVFLDAMFDFSPYDFITMDNMKMTFDMVRHFWRLGHTKIGMLYAEGGSNLAQRKLAFPRALAALDLPFREEWMFRIGSTLETAQADMLEKIQGNADLPTAFFAANDMIAVGAIAALQSLNYKIPEDISIGGFDDIPVASFIEPHLTTISVPKADIGALAVSTLLSRIKKRHAAAGSCCVGQKSVLSGELVIRQSTGANTNEKVALTN